MKAYADHFSRVASGYAECRPGYPEELFDYLAGLVPERELAWDCAAGSGQATVPLARRFQRVVATDLSADMLARAPRHPKIEYRAAPAEQSGLGQATVDLVTVAQALHWLDLDPFYVEVRRVLKADGVLAVWTYGGQRTGVEALDRRLLHFYAEVVGPYWTPERRHVEAGYRTISFPFKEIDPPGFDMQAHWSLPQLLGYVRTWSATQRFRESAGHDPVEVLGRELERDWGDPAMPRGITWPLSLRVGYRPT